MKLLIAIPHAGLFAPQGGAHFLRAFLSLLSGYDLCYLTPAGSDIEKLTREFPGNVHLFTEPSVLGRQVPQLIDYSAGYTRQLLAAVRAEQPDLVLFNFPWGLASNGARLPVPAIYLSHGVESDFAEVILSNFKLNYWPLRVPLTAWLRRLEKTACAHAAKIFAISRNDIDRFETLYKLPANRCWELKTPATIHPRPDSAARVFAKEQLGFDRGQSVVLFHGSWSHFPNREAIAAIRNEIAPALPAVHFLIAGTDVPQFTENNVRSLGFVGNLTAILHASDLALMPIFSGCGVRMKLFDYIADWLPVVSTRKGIEGVPLTDGQEILLADNSPQSIVEAITRAIAQPDLCAAVAAGAAAFIEKHHNAEKLRREVEDQLLSLAGTARQGGLAGSGRQHA